MRKMIGILLIVMGLVVVIQADNLDNNPFFSEFKTPFQVPPFDKIRLEHYLPAMKEGMIQQNQEIKDIGDNPKKPDFQNTIEAMEYSGRLLNTVSAVFYVFLSSMTNDSMQQIAKEIAPLMSQHQDNIYLNPKLFTRVKTVYEQRDKLKLTLEQSKLLEKYYKKFVRGGANLNDTQKSEFRKINEELSVLSLKFGDNILNETNSFMVVIDNKTDLVGLPEGVVESAAQVAKEKNREGQWIFTLQKPSWIPFMQYSGNRNLREKMFKAYSMRGDNSNESDNKENIKRITGLRLKRASLLGYKTHADYILEENMAKTPEKVNEFLMQLWVPALAMAKQEASDMQAMIDKEKGGFKLKAWDWWYYTEKVKKAKYDLDEENLRPYFKLENVIDGAFTVAGKLFGIKFEERKEIPTYHPDVKVYEVKDSVAGQHIGVFYLDYFPRPSKRAGAWMTAFREQSYVNGRKIFPVILNNGNFTKPTVDKPALLTLEEVTTLFHEFGHALHGLLSDCNYESLSGTSVSHDFVELPSQIMENWATDPEVMKLYAKHYVTGEIMPKELMDKITQTEHFNQGFQTIEYLAASILDMDWHTLSQELSADVDTFENQAMSEIGLIPEITPRYRSTNFNHIFSGGYSAGYYSYIWAQVLDADAFQAFKETDLFNPSLAMSFRKNILERGGSDDPMVMYKRFRGREPQVDALLKRKGLK